MKKTSPKQQVFTSATCCTRRQKILAFVALAGLFVCGIFIGLFFYNDVVHRAKGIDGGERTVQKTIQMTAEQCDQIVSNMIHARSADELHELNSVYTNNCAGRVVKNKQVPAVVNIVDVPDMKNMETCEKVETLLLGKLKDERENSTDAHLHNMSVYARLMKSGCVENREKYQQAAQSELDIAKALGATDDIARQWLPDYENIDMTSCQIIENELSRRINSGSGMSFDDYLNNAVLYSTMVEKGCPENQKKYAEKAMSMLEVAYALDTDNLLVREEFYVQEVLEVYKKLQMRDIAHRFLKKVEKMVNPAVDFLIQMEKIINEE